MTKPFDHTLTETILRTQTLIGKGPFVLRHVPWSPQGFMRFQAGTMTAGKFRLLGWGESYDQAVRRAHIAESEIHNLPIN